MNEKISAGFIVAGVIVAVLAGLLIEWLNRVLFSPTCNPNQVSHRLAIFGGPSGYVYGVGASPSCSWQAFNENSQGSFFGPNCSCASRAASAYPAGAPTQNFRPYVRVGTVELPSQ